MHSRMAIALALASVLVLLVDDQASSHCDSLDGPVVAAARKAFEEGKIDAVLKWIGPEHEPEIRRVFAHARSVRVLGDDARELADRFFFETLVRLHREGEGAPYTGLKPAGTTDPVIAAADHAVAQGNVDKLAEELAEAVAHGVQSSFADVMRRKPHAEHSADAGRAYVEAYVTFVHRVEALHAIVSGSAAHEHSTGGESDGHAHSE